MPALAITIIATIILSGIGVIWYQLHSKIDTATSTLASTQKASSSILSERIAKIEIKTSSILSETTVQSLITIAVMEIKLEFERALAPYKGKKHDLETDLINSEHIRKEQLAALELMDRATARAEKMIDKLDKLEKQKS